MEASQGDNTALRERLKEDSRARAEDQLAATRAMEEALHVRLRQYLYLCTSKASQLRSKLHAFNARDGGGSANECSFYLLYSYKKYKY